MKIARNRGFRACDIFRSLAFDAGGALFDHVVIEKRVKLEILATKAIELSVLRCVILQRMLLPTCFNNLVVTTEF